MDIKAKIDEIVKKIQNDPKLLEKFEKNPVSVVEDLLGIDLPDDEVNKIVDAVKAKININDIAGKLGGLFGMKK